MAYQTGSSTSPDDLLDKLRLWLIDMGWTVNKWETDNTKYNAWTGLVGTGKRLHVQKTASTGDVMYFNFRSVNRGHVIGCYDTSSYLMSNQLYPGELTGIAMYGSTGYNGSNNWESQPGAPQTTDNKTFGVCIHGLSLSSIPSYHFFQNGDCYAMVVEYTTGKFQQLIFGTLLKQGTYTGGQFYSGSLPTYHPASSLLNASDAHLTLSIRDISGSYGNGCVYLQADSASRWRSSGGRGYYENDSLHIRFNRICSCGSVITGSNYNSWPSFDEIFYNRGPNAYNTVAPMCPIYVEAKRASGTFSLVGVPEGVRSLNILNYSNAQELTFGSETWMVFAAHDKVADANPNVGFAFKKVV